MTAVVVKDRRQVKRRLANALEKRALGFTAILHSHRGDPTIPPHRRIVPAISNRSGVGTMLFPVLYRKSGIVAGKPYIYAVRGSWEYAFHPAKIGAKLRNTAFGAEREGP